MFHCQQAAEKAMKGLLTFHQQPFAKTHDLRELSKACLRMEPALGWILEQAMPLTWYAWKYRYPGSPEEPTPEEAQGALTVAREVVAALLNRLPAEIRP